MHWDESRQRWIATATIGYDGRGKRVTRKAAGRTKTEAKTRLRELLRDREDGLLVTADGYTVGQAVEDWLTYGLSNRNEATRSPTGISATSMCCLCWEPGSCAI